MLTLDTTSHRSTLEIRVLAYKRQGSVKDGHTSNMPLRRRSAAEPHPKLSRSLLIPWAASILVSIRTVLLVCLNSRYSEASIFGSVGLKAARSHKHTAVKGLQNRGAKTIFGRYAPEEWIPQEVSKEAQLAPPYNAPTIFIANGRYNKSRRNICSKSTKPVIRLPKLLYECVQEERPSSIPAVSTGVVMGSQMYVHRGLSPLFRRPYRLWPPLDLSRRPSTLMDC